MLWPLIFAVLAAILGWKECFGFTATLGGYFQYIAGAFYLFVIAFIGLLIGALFAAFIGVFIPKRWKYTETIKLVSLRNSEGAQGRFFLGTGTIDHTQYYFYYQQVEGGGYKPGRLEIDDNIVVYEEKAREDGELKIYEKQFLHLHEMLTLIAMFCSGDKHEFFIPEGSIKKDFKLS